MVGIFIESVIWSAEILDITFDGHSWSLFAFGATLAGGISVVDVIFLTMAALAHSLASMEFTGGTVNLAAIKIGGFACLVDVVDAKNDPADEMELSWALLSE